MLRTGWEKYNCTPQNRRMTNVKFTKCLCDTLFVEHSNSNFPEVWLFTNFKHFPFLFIWVFERHAILGFWQAMVMIDKTLSFNNWLHQNLTPPHLFHPGTMWLFLCLILFWQSIVSLCETQIHLCSLCYFQNCSQVWDLRVV
jgi:hypothetical protein